MEYTAESDNTFKFEKKKEKKDEFSKFIVRNCCVFSTHFLLHFKEEFKFQAFFQINPFKQRQLRFFLQESQGRPNVPFVSQEGLVSQENKQANVVQIISFSLALGSKQTSFTLVQVLARVLLPHKFFCCGST